MGFIFILKNNYEGTDLTYVKVKNRAVGYNEAVLAIGKNAVEYRKFHYPNDKFIDFHNRQKGCRRIQLEIVDYKKIDTFQV